MLRTEIRGSQADQNLVANPENNPVDFEKLHSALQEVNLLSCRGSVVRVAGLRVESNGPAVGLGELCGIHIRDGRRVLAEVVGFQKDHYTERQCSGASAERLGRAHRQQRTVDGNRKEGSGREQPAGTEPGEN